MTKAEHLIRRAEACGFVVVLAAGGPSLTPTRPEAFCPPKLLADLKASRGVVVEWLAAHPPEPTVCSLCSGVWFCPPDAIADLASSPHVCDRAGAKAVRSKTGAEVTPAVPRCPYKAKGSP